MRAVALFTMRAIAIPYMFVVAAIIVASLGLTLLLSLILNDELFDIAAEFIEFLVTPLHDSLHYITEKLV